MDTLFCLGSYKFKMESQKMNHGRYKDSDQQAIIEFSWEGQVLRKIESVSEHQEEQEEQGTTTSRREGELSRRYG